MTSLEDHILSEQDVRILTQIIKSQFSYDFSGYSFSFLTRRISRFMVQQNIESFSLLRIRLANDPEFVSMFISDLSVNVTEMFREPDFWKCLRDQVIPEIALGKARIKIWHAGCATGEEALSMAILLEEMGLADHAYILATDLNAEVVERARLGRSKLHQLDKNRENYLKFSGSERLERYYSLGKDFAQFHPKIIKKIDYRVSDLVGDKITDQFDLIICRNVLIYFNQDLQHLVLNNFYHQLNRLGFLALGASESITWFRSAENFIQLDPRFKI